MGLLQKGRSQREALALTGEVLVLAVSKGERSRRCFEGKKCMPTEGASQD